MADLKSLTLKNVTLKWPFLAEPQTRGEYASNKYQVDVLVSKEDAEAMKELANPRQKFKKVDDLYSITLKSSKKPRVIGAKKQILSDEELKKIGNGTIAHVKVNQYKGYKDQVFLGLKAIMVTNFHEYTGGDDFEDIEVEDDTPPFEENDDDELI